MPRRVKACGNSSQRRRRRSGAALASSSRTSISATARSVVENIRYGRPDASDEEVLDAAFAARCDFIEDLYRDRHCSSPFDGQEFRPRRRAAARQGCAGRPARSPGSARRALSAARAARWVASPARRPPRPKSSTSTRKAAKTSFHGATALGEFVRLKLSCSTKILLF
jgi:hypothetical protein